MRRLKLTAWKWIDLGKIVHELLVLSVTLLYWKLQPNSFFARHTNSTTLYPFLEALTILISRLDSDFSNLKVGSLLGKQGWPARSIQGWIFSLTVSICFCHFSTVTVIYVLNDSISKVCKSGITGRFEFPLTISWDQEFLSRCDMKHWIRLAINVESLYCNNVSVPILAQPLVPRMQQNFYYFPYIFEKLFFLWCAHSLVFEDAEPSCQRASLAWIVYSISNIVDVARDNIL